MEKIGYKPNIVTYGMIMNDLCKIGKTSDAIGLLRKMDKGNLELNIVLYNTIIDSLCKDKLVIEALNILPKMTNRGIQPDVCTYNSLIQGLCIEWMKLSKHLIRSLRRIVRLLLLAITY